MALNLETLADPAALALRGLELLEQHGADSLRERGRFVVSLAGGSTPKAVYRLWGERSVLDWPAVALYFGDERCVPPEHPESNAGMVEASLLSGLASRPAVHRMRGEHDDPEEAAREYGAALTEHFGGGGSLDLALLGIGGDGHTASLFPGREALGEQTRLCVATLAPDGESRRITLTAPALRAARHIVFMAAGADKADILRQVVRGPVDSTRLPSQLFFRDETLAVTLLRDAAAAAGLA